MEENKKRLGKLIIVPTGQEIEIESVLVGHFVGNRRVHIYKTELGTYVINLKREDGEEKMDEQLHMKRESFSALFLSMLQFIEDEEEDFKEFLDVSVDEESGILYKQSDDLKEEEE